MLRYYWPDVIFPMLCYLGGLGLLVTLVYLWKRVRGHPDPSGQVAAYFEQRKREVTDAALHRPDED